MPFARSQSVYTTSVRRPWRKVDVDGLRAAVLASRLGRVDLLSNDVDVDTLTLTLICSPSPTVSRQHAQSPCVVDHPIRGSTTNVEPLSDLYARQSVFSVAVHQLTTLPRGRHVVATTALFYASNVMRFGAIVPMLPAAIIANCGRRSTAFSVVGVSRLLAILGRQRYMNFSTRKSTRLERQPLTQIRQLLQYTSSS